MVNIHRYSQCTTHSPVKILQNNLDIVRVGNASGAAQLVQDCDASESVSNSEEADR